MGRGYRIAMSDRPEQRWRLVAVFRAIALAEGVALPLLLVAAVVKYAVGFPLGVEILGPLHGSLFIGYVSLLGFVRRPLCWDTRMVLVALVASIVPFGTWGIESEIRRQLRAALRSASGSGEPTATPPAPRTASAQPHR